MNITGLVDPNKQQLREETLKVACSYCQAKVGEQCHHGGRIRRNPHHARIQAFWRHQYQQAVPRRGPSYEEIKEAYERALAAEED